MEADDKKTPGGKVSIYKLRQEASEERNPGDTLILDSQPPELWSSHRPCCGGHPVCSAYGSPSRRAYLSSAPLLPSRSWQQSWLPNCDLWKRPSLDFQSLPLYAYVSWPQETSFPIRVQPRRCNLGPVRLVSSCPRHMLASSCKRWLQESTETQECVQLASQLWMPQSLTFPREFTLLLAESIILRTVRSSKTLATWCKEPTHWKRPRC